MEKKTMRIGEEPVFDTDRAWERFEKLTAKEPVPAAWRRVDTNWNANTAKAHERLPKSLDDQEKDGDMEMMQKNKFAVPQEASVIGAMTSQGSARTDRANGAWRTERPVRRKLRRLTSGLAAAVVTISLFTTPLGDRALAAMMQTFRIQHLVGVGMSADDMTSISQLLELGSPEGERSFDLAQYGAITQSGGGESRAMTWDEAEKQTGSPLLRLEGSGSPVYQPETTLTFHLNVSAVNRLLTRLGSATTLPAEADGQAIRLHVPDGVTAEGSLSGKPVRLLQYGKPELTVEEGIDAALVREAVLGLPVLPDSLRTKLAAIGDWRSTLPVPARDGMVSNLKLGGRDAIMTISGKNRFLFWLDGDRMGLLKGEVKDFPTEAAFRQAAEELIRP
ncbi:hypothetical protein SAMN02799630_01798 [Paenibacillus sp. UNCCL117]|uniref:hypothetical protein n=1 Tax=unclassified Paenibacillus TaxID=185978 RepID=UPI0008854788|nr:MULTISPECIES: hypothetical protein [unclassified Paenibacillus]SDC94185.1 hypothetical protein SAMN04488602_104286 [Paenibacillus sp. cl123]SFW29751.1 hypothetical protein SAMN02799630_01798 [Paenibacillus sp. UNCCL117]